MYKDTFDRIDELAKVKKISRRRLAQMAGINVNTVSSLYRRRPARFPERYIEPIANVLGVPPSELRNANNLIVITGNIRPIPAAENNPEQETAPRPVSAIMADLEALGREELQILDRYIDLLLQEK